MARVGFEVVDGVARIVLDHPEKANCITAKLTQEIQSVCDEIDNDGSIGCAIVSGAGGTFCSGADLELLKQVAADPAESSAFTALGQIYEAFWRIGRLAVPTIAAVRGSAVGAGVNLMLVTDLRVVADDASIQPGFHRLGLHPGGGHFTLLSRVAHLDACAALGLFGARLSGREAAQAGLAWRSLPDLEVEPAAEKLAAIPASDPELARHAVRSMRTQLGPPAMPWNAASDFERSSQMWSLRRISAWRTDNGSSGKTTDSDSKEKAVERP